MNKHLIFTATYNEYPNIKYLLKKIKDLRLNLDILIIDDNSTDRTKSYLNNYKKFNSNFFLINRKKS